MKALSWHYCDGLFWVRVFGRGFAVKDVARHPLLFSQRNGLVPMWRVGRYCVTWLKVG